MQQDKLLVIGAAGFLGSTLCRRLNDLGIPFRGLDINPPRAELHNGSIDWIHGSFLDADTLREAMSDCDVICHLACTSIPETSNRSPISDCTDNLLGTLQLLDVAKEAKIKRIVFLSSGGTVYGSNVKMPIHEDAQTDPICAYGIHKLAIEKYLRLYGHMYGINYQILRVSNPYGVFQDVARPQGAVAVFLNRALAGIAIDIWGDGSVIRDYIDAEDVASAVVAAVKVDASSGIYNIGYGKGASLNDVVSTLESVLNRKIDVNYLPGRSIDVPENVLDINHAIDVLGWEPGISLHAGIQNLVNYHLSLNELQTKNEVVSQQEKAK